MIKASYTAYLLKFKLPAGTSRGVLLEKPIYILKLEKEGRIGYGEVSFIEGLSCESQVEIIHALDDICSNEQINTELLKGLATVPSVRFALEQALLELDQNDQHLLFPGEFTLGLKGIPINGLVWMGDKNYMRQQIKEKIANGYGCLKLKIGALHFNDEMELLQEIRKDFGIQELEIRVDANGAFSKNDALEKLNRLSEFDLHSIEQPIRAGQVEVMADLCKKSPIAIALDEELIGVHTLSDQEQLIQTIQPHYIILKPSLLGGFEVAKNWINLANQYHAHWWITSALESNLGLNAIAQWTATLNNAMPQGLGTGSLYQNNFESPLEIHEGKLFYRPTKKWNFQL